MYLDLERTIAIDALRRHLPRGHFLQQVREMKDDLVWHQALDGWAKQQADFSTLVYKCSEEYGRLWPHLIPFDFGSLWYIIYMHYVLFLSMKPFVVCIVYTILLFITIPPLHVLVRLMVRIRRANGCGTAVEYTFEESLRGQIHIHSNGGALFF
jgi:hypothetical protein